MQFQERERYIYIYWEEDSLRSEFLHRFWWLRNLNIKIKAILCIRHSVSHCLCYFAKGISVHELRRVHNDTRAQHIHTDAIIPQCRWIFIFLWEMHITAKLCSTKNRADWTWCMCSKKQVATPTTLNYTKKVLCAVNLNAAKVNLVVIFFFLFVSVAPSRTHTQTATKICCR